MPVSSFNEIAEIGSHGAYANAEGFWPILDDAANTTIVDISSNARDATLGGGDDTEDLTIAGPNSWLTAGINLTGYPDTITFNSAIVPPTVKMFSGWFKWPSTPRYLFGWNSNLNARPNLHVASSTSFLLYLGASNFRYFGVPTMAVDTWYHVALYIAGNGQSDITSSKLYLNGTQATNGSTTSAGAVDTINLSRIGGGYFSDPTGVSGVLNADVELADGEVNEIVDGPEPVVLSGADTIAGTEQEGETLSMSLEATWGLASPFSSGSNGTITFSYQWTRSEDATATGETNISGATSATYDCDADDVGYFLRRWRRGTNSGGFDAAADHASNFTGAIAAAGGAPIGIDQQTLAGRSRAITAGVVYGVELPQPTLAKRSRALKTTLSNPIALPQPTLAKRSRAITAGVVYAYALPQPTLAGRCRALSVSAPFVTDADAVNWSIRGASRRAATLRGAEENSIVRGGFANSKIRGKGS